MPQLRSELPTPAAAVPQHSGGSCWGDASESQGACIKLGLAKLNASRWYMRCRTLDLSCLLPAQQPCRSAPNVCSQVSVELHTWSLTQHWQRLPQTAAAALNLRMPVRSRPFNP